MDKKGLVFGILGLYVLSLVAALVIIFGTKSESKIAAKEVNAGLMLSQGNIGLVQIYGSIQFSDNEWMLIPRDADRVVSSLKAFSENDRIKAVILKINSPGGSVGAVQEIYAQVQKLRQKGKKVVVSMGDVAASGGYYIAAAADKIVANPGTLTGSIGVILEIGTMQELLKKVGVKIETIKSGKMKDIGNFSRAMTEEERTLLQGLINNSYDQFVQAIVAGRGMDKQKVLSLADGRIYTGEQAMAAGLIDSLGNYDDAIKVAADLAGIKGQPKVVTDIEPFERMFGAFTTNSSAIVLKNILPNHKVRFEYTME